MKNKYDSDYKKTKHNKDGLKKGSLVNFVGRIC